MRHTVIYPLLHRDIFSAKNGNMDSRNSNPASETAATLHTVASLDEVNRWFDLPARPLSGSRRGIANACGFCRGLRDSSFCWIPAILRA
jgi:hypothetical protein